MGYFLPTRMAIAIRLGITRMLLERAIEEDSQ